MSEEIEVVSEVPVNVPTTSEGTEKSLVRTALISDIIFYFAMVAMVICAVLFSRGAMGTQSFGGYQFREVLSTSMESVYPRGSLLIIKQVPINDLVVGDDITFGRDSLNIITHRIVEIEENYEGSGKRAFITKGTENKNADTGVVLADNVIGKVVKGIPRLGKWLSWLGSNLWAILAVFLSLVVFSFFLKLFVKLRKKDMGQDQRLAKEPKPKRIEAFWKKLKKELKKKRDDKDITTE
nr:signal peptidase I [Ohessyouella blattaphilus]